MKPSNPHPYPAAKEKEPMPMNRFRKHAKPKVENAFAKRMGACAVAFVLLLGFAVPSMAASYTTMQNAATSNAMGTALDVSTAASVYVEVTVSGAANVLFKAQGNAPGAGYAPLTCKNVSTEAQQPLTQSTSAFVCQVKGLKNFLTPIENCTACTVTVRGIASTGNISTMLSTVALQVATGVSVGGASSFDQLSGGTNTSATMYVGTGGTIAATGAGTVSANQLMGQAPASDDQMFISTATNTGGWKSIPDCQDSSGNHLNYNATTNSISCGSTTSGGGTASAAGTTGSIQSNSGGVLADSGCTSSVSGQITCPGGFVAGTSAVGILTLNWGSTGAAGLGATQSNLYIGDDGLVHTIATGSVVATYVTTDSIATFTNKAYNVESAGNVFTTVRRLFFPAAGVNGTTAGSVWNLPSSSPAVANYVTGTDILVGTLDFADASDLNAQINYALPASWTGTVDARLQWFSSATSGNVVWNIQTACVGNGETAAGATYNATGASNTITDAAMATSNYANVATLAGLTMTGCNPGDSAYFKVRRNANDAGDTMAGTARMLWLEVTLREQL